MNIKKIIKEELDDLSWIDDVVPNQLVTVHNVYIGMRVKINENPKDYGDSVHTPDYFLRQSEGGQGTVIGLVDTLDEDDYIIGYGWARVRWDRGYDNVYQIGYGDTYSLIIVL